MDDKLIKKQVVERIFYTLSKKDIRPTVAAREIGFSTSAFTDWKNGKGTPSATALYKLSKYLHVSIDYLVTGEEFDKSTSPVYAEELHMLSTFRRIPEKHKAKAIGYIEGLAAAFETSSDDN